MYGESRRAEEKIDERMIDREKDDHRGGQRQGHKDSVIAAVKEKKER